MVVENLSRTKNGEKRDYCDYPPVSFKTRLELEELEDTNLTMVFRSREIIVNWIP